MESRNGPIQLSMYRGKKESKRFGFRHSPDSVCILFSRPTRKRSQQQQGARRALAFSVAQNPRFGQMPQLRTADDAPRRVSSSATRPRRLNAGSFHRHRDLVPTTMRQAPGYPVTTACLHKIGSRSPQVCATKTAACPAYTPRSSRRFHTVVSVIMKRLPLRAMRMPE
jgi:hypothetical protein